MSDITVNMRFVRATKNTFVYSADSQSAAVTTVYIQKHCMPEAPSQLKLTLELPKGQKS